MLVVAKKNCLLSFLQVRVVVQFRGREQSHMDLGTVLLDKVVKDMDVRDAIEAEFIDGRLTPVRVE